MNDWKNTVDELDEFQDWLDIQYPNLLTKVERKVCRCLKGKKLAYLQKNYPLLH